MYSTLKECRTSYFLLSASTKIRVAFELYSAKTGQLLWHADYRVSERSFDITRDRLRLKISQILEPALQQIVDTALETLPDPPEM